MMKCRSVASIWSNSPPSHKVNAVAVLHDPPTLYTAGSDGSIIWWNLSFSEQNHHATMDIEPIAMLCGHAASVVDLGICYPTMDDMTSDRNNDAAVSSSVKCGALISACVEGVLCVWSRNSGNCRRRRKMPPWVGSPLMIQPLPENQRYVCIGCGFTSHVHLNDNQLVDQVGEVDVESHNGRPSKCTVVIVDTYTLTIVQTVFHENLLGPLKAIALVNPTEEREKQLVCIVDIWGKVQYVPVMKNSDGNGENGSSTSNNSTHIEIEECVHDLKEKGHLVSFANRGQLIALFYRTCCIFKWLNGNSVGEISFLDDPLFLESKSYVRGGIFLDNDARIQCHHEELDNILEESIAVWNNRGSAMLYRISYSSNTFNSEPMCVIPPSSNQPDAELALCFVQFNKCLICVSSLCINSAKPSLWEPYITSWLLSKKIHTSGKTCLEYKSVGKRGFFDNILDCDFKEIQGVDFDASTSATDGVCSIASQDSNMGMRNAKIINGKDRNNNIEFISSSMILSDNYYIPSAIVYGFHSGDIEIVRFDMSSERVDSHSLMDLCDHKQRLSGHTGAVLCLAAHHITNLKSRFNLILISGGMDCTVRLWDLESSTPVAVMRQHVEPVHQIILPPLYTVYPWSDCFLAVGEDFCVSLTSIDTLRVERMFPGHPYYPARVLWDGARGYMACLCPNRPGASNSSDVLYIWDLKSGARERVLKGSAAHSMYDHLHSGINKAVPSGSPINRNTSASSLLLPVTEEARHLQSGVEFSGKAGSLLNMTSAKTMTEFNVLQPQATTSGSSHYELTTFQYKMQPIRSSCPFPGVAALCFDPTSLMSLCKKNVLFEGDAPKKDKSNLKEVAAGAPNAVTPKAVTNNALVKDIRPEIHESHHMGIGNLNGATDNASEYVDEVLSVEASLLHFSLSLLHLWDLDPELDKLLINEMKLKKPHGLKVASGLLGDRGALTLVFPNLSANLELWKSSSEYCAMRSLAMVSLSQHMISLSHSCSAASSFFCCASLWIIFR
ncbi:hypothetical protein Leryth_019324 [Lithospermum erythrorhizon]|nr:hypothetical protein Leryth_019324 [Lithospermum erythrorhizon]